MRFLAREERFASRSMYALFACSARLSRSSGERVPSGSTSRSNRSRNLSRAGCVRARRSCVRLQEISAAMRLSRLGTAARSDGPTASPLLQERWRLVSGLRKSQHLSLRVGAAPMCRRARGETETETAGGGHQGHRHRPSPSWTALPLSAWVRSRR